MKKIKNYAMALVALVIATGSVTLMSFKTDTKFEVEKNTLLINEYWDFIGAVDPNDNNPEDPNQYQLGSENSSCVTGSEPCQVHAPSNGNPTNPKPDLSQPAPNFSSQTVLQRIQAAQSTGGNETLTMKD